MNGYTIRLIAAANGERTPHDKRYLRAYEAAAMDTHGVYHGGRLESTASRAEALHFATAAEALRVVQQQCGVRPDGKPNRPLTAWHCEIAKEG